MDKCWSVDDNNGLMQNLESKQLMHQLLTDPPHFEKHLQRYAASVVTSFSYGRRVESVDEWVVQENMAAMDCAYRPIISFPFTHTDRHPAVDLTR